MKASELDESSKFFENKIVHEYVSTRVAAQFLGISENALRIKVCRGLIPYYHFGRSLRFRISEISMLFHRKE
jgi:hypothetical protein